MYIPSLLFGAVNTCISASGEQETGQFISGSQVWRYHKFTTLGSGSFTIHSGSTNDARVFIVGGGAGGGRTTEGGGGSPQGAGGGGAGGVVWTDYRLGPGSYTLYVGDGGQENQDGEDSWIEMEYLPSDYLYYAPTGSRLTAEGGGRGAYFSGYVDGSGKNANNGGSGGGLARGLLPSGYINASNGSGRNPQGSSGGAYDGTYGGSWEGGSGGGGAGGNAPDINGLFNANKQSRGGHGRLFNIDGTSRYYAGGGGGLGENDAWPSTVSLGSNYYGGGGSGSNSGVNGNPGTIDGHDKRDGRQGIISIIYPVCNLELTTCTTYAVNGGSNGGNITFIPCGQRDLETITLDPLDEITICSYPISLPKSYPSSSGDVTFNSTGSCNVYIEPPNPPSCPTGSVLSPLYLTQVDVNAPDVGPYPGYVFVNWTDYLGEANITQVGTGVHDFCAVSGSVFVSGYTSLATWTITHTATQCGYYCSGSF